MQDVFRQLPGVPVLLLRNWLFPVSVFYGNDWRYGPVLIQCHLRVTLQFQCVFPEKNRADEIRPFLGKKLPHNSGPLATWDDRRMTRKDHAPGHVYSKNCPNCHRWYLPATG